MTTYATSLQSDIYIYLQWNNETLHIVCDISCVIKIDRNFVLRVKVCTTVITKYGLHMRPTCWGFILKPGTVCSTNYRNNSGIASSQLLAVNYDN